ncbi:MAG: (Fe-S)-binding protein [bacterium]
MQDPSERPLVRTLKIVRTVPCLADPSKIRFTAEFDRDVSAAFPYLNSVLNQAIYNHAAKTLTIRKDTRLITLYPTRVEAAKINHQADAAQVVNWIVQLTNECYRKRATITPNFERRDRLTVLDVVRLLPGTNCKKCRQFTCLAFAAQLVVEKASVLDCRDLYMADHQPQRQELFALLRAAGYPVPDAIF